MNNKYLIIIISVFTFSVKSAEVDRILLPQRSFCSSAFRSLGDAGIALPVDISGAMINPALLYSYRRSIEDVHGSVMVGYGRDSVYDRHILPAGVSYSTAEGSMGFFYRFLQNSSEMKQNEMTLNISGQLAGTSDEQGAVDFGLNIRFENFDWPERPLEGLPSNMITRDSSGHLTVDTIGYSEKYTGNISENRLLFDIGFFQANVWPNTDFGLTLRNLFGYTWTKENPVIGYTDHDTVPDSTKTDSVVVRSYYYKDKTSKSKSWTDGKYRTLAAGIVYRIEMAGGNLVLSLPLDIEVLGLFDKNTKTRLTVHGGIQAKISQRFNLRIGYSRAPGPIKTGLKEIKNLNVFTGGAGISIAPVTLDFYISDQAFGATAGFDY